MPKVHFIPAGPIEIVFAGEDAKTANDARTRTVATFDQLAVDMFPMVIYPPRVPLSIKVDVRGANEVARSGKFPPGPKMG